MMNLLKAFQCCYGADASESFHHTDGHLSESCVDPVITGEPKPEVPEYGWIIGEVVRLRAMPEGDQLRPKDAAADSNDFGGPYELEEEADEWDITLDLGESPDLGMVMADHRGQVVIDSVQDEGALSVWNSRQTDLSRRARYGDIIMRVDGSALDTQATLNDLGRSLDDGQIVLRLRRVRRFRTRLQKAGPSGISLTDDLVVERVAPGFIQVYNNRAKAGMRILPGDRLVEVGGIRNDKPAMTAVLKGPGNAVSLIVDRD